MYISAAFGLLICVVTVCESQQTENSRNWFTVCKDRRQDNAVNVYREHPVSSHVECASACKDDDKCVSANLIRHTLGYTCQLMSDQSNDCDALQEDHKSVYIKLDAGLCIHGGKWNFIKQNCGTCENGFAGIFCERHIIDCVEGTENGQTGTEKVLLKPANSSKPFQTVCKFDWGATVIGQRKQCDKFGNFNQTWSAYKEGFGRLDCSFFVGLENIHLLTKRREIKLKVQTNKSAQIAWYRGFRLDGETDNYTMHYEAYSSPPTRRSGDGFGMGAPTASINHARFCTPDHDCNSCALTSSSGWWFNSNCAYINLHIPCSGTELNWPKDSTDNTTERITGFQLVLRAS